MKFTILMNIEKFIVMLFLINILRGICIMLDPPPTYEEVTAINPPTYEQATMNTVIQVDMTPVKKQTCFEAFKEAYPERSNRIKFMLVLIFIIVTVISWIIGLIFGLVFIAIGLVSFFIAIVIGLRIK